MSKNKVVWRTYLIIAASLIGQLLGLISIGEQAAIIILAFIWNDVNDK